MTNIQAGWHPDPAGRHEYRYWDGQQWSDQVSDGGVTATDPLPSAPQPSAVEPDPTVVNPAGPVDAPKSGRPKGLLIGGAVAVVAVVALAVFLITRGDDEPAQPAASVGEVPTETPALPGESDLFGEDGSLEDMMSELDDLLGGLDDQPGGSDDFGLGDLESLFGDLEGLDEDELLSQMFGFTPEQMQCLEQEFAVLEEMAESMTEQEAMSLMFTEVFDAFASCGVSMQDLMTGAFTPEG